MNIKVSAYWVAAALAVGAVGFWLYQKYAPKKGDKLAPQSDPNKAGGQQPGISRQNSVGYVYQR